MQLVNELRRLGATRIKVGDVEVVFEQDEAPYPMPPKLTEEEAKKQAEALLFASSD